MTSLSRLSCPTGRSRPATLGTDDTLVVALGQRVDDGHNKKEDHGQHEPLEHSGDDVAATVSGRCPCAVGLVVQLLFLLSEQVAHWGFQLGTNNGYFTQQGDGLF